MNPLPETVIDAIDWLVSFRSAIEKVPEGDRRQAVIREMHAEARKLEVELSRLCECSAPGC